jgi:hypothetical protein
MISSKEILDVLRNDTKRPKNEALGLDGVTKLAELAGLSITPAGAVIGGLGSIRALMNILGMGLLSERSYFLPKQFKKAIENFPELLEYLNRQIQRYAFFVTLSQLIHECCGILLQQSSDKKKASFIFFGETNEIKQIVKITECPNVELEEQIYKLVTGDFPDDENINFWTV